MQSKLQLVPPLFSWQSWPRGYVPSDLELEQMTEDEYDAWSAYEFRDSIPQTCAHPTRGWFDSRLP